MTADHLQLARVQVSVSPLSLLQGALDQLVIDAPALDVVRSAKGVISVAGFELKPTGKPSPALDWLLSQREIVVRGGSINWQDQMPKHGSAHWPTALSLSNVQLTLQGGLRSHAIWLEATPDKAFGQSVQFKGRFTQPLLDRPSQWQNWTGQLYVQLNQPKISRYVSVVWPTWQLPTLDDAAQIGVWADVDKAQLQRASAKATALPLLASELVASYDRQQQSVQFKGKNVQWTGLGQLALPLMDANQATVISDLPKDGRIEQLAVDLKGWDGGKMWTELEAQASFTSSDVAGRAKAKWQRSTGSREAGQLELNSTLSKVDLTALHRYLPTSMSAPMRQYIHNAFERGQAQDVQLKFNGALKDLPTQLGVSGRLRDVQFVFAPNWPSLAQTSAQFDLQGSSLAISKIETQFADLPVQGSVRIADVKNPSLDIALTSAKAPMVGALAMVARTPIQGWTQGFLNASQGTGHIDIKAQLLVPLGAPRQSKVTGQLTFHDNDVALAASIPPLSKLKGQMSFTESSVNLQNIRAQALGGEVSASGNLDRITAQGTLSVDGLKAWKTLPASAVAMLGAASGTAAYQVLVQPLAKDGNKLRVESNLAGLALTLPAPLTKPAQALWPTVYEQSTLPAVGQRIAMTMGDKLSAELLAKDGAVQGQIELGSPAPIASHALPPAAPSSLLQGLLLNIQLASLDVSAWQRAIEPALLASSAASGKSTSAVPMPTHISAYVQDVVWSDRHFAQVVLGASRVGTVAKPVWRVNAQANDFNGYGEYTSTSDGEALLYARLAKLTIPDATSQSRIEQLLDSPQTSLPNLDIVVDEFELTGKKLGRLEVIASNQRSASQLGAAAQEWRMQKLVLANADATLNASGVWAKPRVGEPSKVDVQFNWQLQSSGDLLTRLGMPGLLKDGKGLLQGRVGWRGSPLALHYPSLTGQIKLDMAKGQFLKVDPGAGRLLGVLSLQALPRLFTLDFRDLFSEGFAFDGVTGDAQIKEGVLSTQNLQMKSVLALVSIDGTADIAKTTQNLHVLVLPDINAGGASLIATLINPIVGAVTYLTQLVLRRPAVAAATKAYKIEGTWREPVVTSVSP